MSDALKGNTSSENEIESDLLPVGEEVIQQPWNPNDSRVDTRVVTIDLIKRRLEEDEIDLQPDFQRHGGIWNDQQKSWLIESLLIKIPLPMFYFDASDEDRWIVIDGLQRLTALKQFFIQGFKLKRLQYLSQYDGSGYDDLPRHLRRRIEETQVTVNLIQPGTPEKVKFDIFRRINTGGITLSAQEIRNALNQGPVTQLLKDLASSQEFRIATGGSVTSDRMNDQDFVLRFLAFLINGYDSYENPDIDAYLHTSMSDLNGMTDRYGELKEKFMFAMILANKIFGKFAFRKIYDHSSTRNPINKALFEAWSIALSGLSVSQAEKMIANRERAIELLIKYLTEDKEFEKAVSYGTQDVGKTKRRFKTIQNIVDEVVND